MEALLTLALLWIFARPIYWIIYKIVEKGASAVPQPPPPVPPPIIYYPPPVYDDAHPGPERWRKYVR